MKGKVECLHFFIIIKGTPMGNLNINLISMDWKFTGKSREKDYIVRTHSMNEICTWNRNNIWRQMLHIESLNKPVEYNTVLQSQPKDGDFSIIITD